MEIENPLALQFIMQDELFLLNKDKSLYSNIILAVPNTQGIAGEPPILEIEEAKVSFNYLGNNKNGLLVLVHYPNLEFIAEAHLTALENILKRKGLAIDDAAILNLAKHAGADFDGITSHFNPQKILLLGKNALPAGIVPLKINEPKPLAGIAALYSFSFDEMMDSNDNKKAFWEQMKGL